MNIAKRMHAITLAGLKYNNNRNVDNKCWHQLLRYKTKLHVYINN